MATLTLTTDLTKDVINPKNTASRPTLAAGYAKTIDSIRMQDIDACIKAAQSAPTKEAAIEVMAGLYGYAKAGGNAGTNPN